MPPYRPTGPGPWLSGLAACGMLALGSPAAASPQAALQPAERAELEAGGTLVEWTAVRWESDPASEPSQRAVVGRRLLAAPPERVARAVADYRNYHEFMPFLVESEVLSGDAAQAEVRHTIQPPFPARRRECRVILRSVASPDAGGRWLTRWDLVPGSGNVREHRGEWSISRYDDRRTLVTFRWSHDPGGALPRGFTERALERSVPWVLDGLRQQIRRCRYDQPPPPSCNDG